MSARNQRRQIIVLLWIAMAACQSSGDDSSTQPDEGAATSAAESGTGGDDSPAGGGSGGGSSAQDVPGGAGTGMSGGSGAGSPTDVPADAPEWQRFMDPTPATLGSEERGQYLVDHVLLCGVCHTPSLDNGEPNMELYLAGSRSYDFTDVDGTIITVNAENLTSHIPEGLGTWTDGQIRTAITKGVDDEHYAMYPIMPYPEYSLMTPEDVDSVIKYLRTVAAVGVSMFVLALACGCDSSDSTDGDNSQSIAGDGAGDDSSASGTGGTDGSAEMNIAATPELMQAIATIAPLGDARVTGTAAFLKTDAGISLVVALNNCPDGPHGVHIHQGTSCADDDSQGGHWDMTRGEGIPDVVCQDGKGTSMVVRDASDPELAWTIGGPASTSIVGHVVVVHGDGSPAPRIGCGPITVR